VTAPIGRGLVAAIFSAGAVVGMLLLHCADPPHPNTAYHCQALVWGAWVLEQNTREPLAPIPLSIARQLVRDMRRCSGLETFFVNDMLPADPFGIGGEPSPPLDGGIYRSR
jgi:hypothetical protein